MKRFTRLFAVMMAVLMVLASLCISAAAEGEEEATTEAAKPELAQPTVMDLWDPEIFTPVFTSAGSNQTAWTLTEEGLRLEYTGDETVEQPDPYFTFPISTYFKKTSTAAPKPEVCNYVVIKMKCEGCDGMFELFAKAAAGDSETVTYEEADLHEDGWYYLIFDMELTSLVEDRKLTTMRLDWSCGGTAVGANMTIGAIGFFNTEEEADNFCGIEYVTMAPKTKAPKTEAPTEPATEPEPEPATEPEKSGCGAIVASGAVLVMMAAAAAVALKRH